MKDKIFMILLGIIAVNLTIQTVKDVGIFPTAYAQVETDAELVARIQQQLFDEQDAYLDSPALIYQTEAIRKANLAMIESLRDDLIFFTRNIQVITW